MAWYWWILIAAAAVLVGWLKLKVLGRVLNRRKKEAVREEE